MLSKTVPFAMCILLCASIYLCLHVYLCMYVCLALEFDFKRISFFRTDTTKSYLTSYCRVRNVLVQFVFRDGIISRLCIIDRRPSVCV